MILKLFNPFLIDVAYAAEKTAKKGMPLQIIIPFTILMVPVIIFILMKAKPRLEKKYDENEEKENK